MGKCTIPRSDIRERLFEFIDLMDESAMIFDGTRDNVCKPKKEGTLSLLKRKHNMWTRWLNTFVSTTSTEQCEK